MAELRAATAAIHNELDSNPRMANYLQTRSGVAELLSRWYGFLFPYQKRLEAARPELADFARSRSKTALLVADLSVHGIPAVQVRLCKDIPTLGNEAEMLGAMYVTEGATLGGRVIARQLERNLGLADNRGYSFFNCYGDNTGAMWKAFSSTVEDSCSELPDVAVGSAIRTFNSIRDWLVA